MSSSHKMSNVIDRLDFMIRKLRKQKGGNTDEFTIDNNLGNVSANLNISSNIISSNVYSNVNSNANIGLDINGNIYTEGESEGSNDRYANETISGEVNGNIYTEGEGSNDGKANETMSGEVNGNIIGVSLQFADTDVEWGIEESNGIRKRFSDILTKKIEEAYQKWINNNKSEEYRVFEYKYGDGVRYIDFEENLWISDETRSTNTVYRESSNLDIEGNLSNTSTTHIVTSSVLDGATTQDETNQVLEDLSDISRELKQLIDLDKNISNIDKSLDMLESDSNRNNKPNEQNENETSSVLDGASTKRSVQIKSDGTIVPYIEYIDINRSTYDQFMAYVFNEYGVKQSIYTHQQSVGENKCLDDPKGKEQLTVPQRFIPLYIAPESPYKGLFMYHLVGSGKTRVALQAMSKYYSSSRRHTSTERTKLIWITTRSLVLDVQHRFEEFKYFWDRNESPFVTGETLWRGDGPIHLFSLKEFENGLKGKNEFAKKVLWRNQEDKCYKWRESVDGNGIYKWQSESEWDPLEGCFIVLDEVHKLYEKQTNVNRLFEQAIFDSYIKSKRNQTSCVRLLILTGTPVPSIHLRFTGPPVTKDDIPVYDIPYTLFRVINLLIDDEARRLPSTKAQFLLKFGRSITEMSDQIKSQFKELLKGLVSYFDPSIQYDYYAKRVKKINVIASGTPEMISKIEKHCNSPAMQKSDDNGLNIEQGRCLMWSSNWAGDKEYNWPPKTWKIGWQANTIDFDYRVKEDILEHIPKLSPKTMKLMENIKSLDEQDRKKFNKLYKHYIFSNLPPSRGSSVVASTLQATGYKYVRAPNIIHSLGLKAVITKREMNELEVTEPFIVGNLPDTNKHPSNNFFYLEDSLHANERNLTKLVFSDHRINNYGQIARIVLVDREFKEGINLMDVKYIHILEPQLTDTDEQQIIGRAVRRCGHSGLPYDEWTYEVYIYDVEVPSYLFGDGNGVNNKTLISDQYLKRIIDPSIVQEETLLLNIIKDVAVDKQLNDEKLSGKFKQAIDAKNVTKVENIFIEDLQQSRSLTLTQPHPQPEAVREINQSTVFKASRDIKLSTVKDNRVTKFVKSVKNTEGKNLRDMFLLSFFRYTPEYKFVKRREEMVSKMYDTSLKGFKYPIEEAISKLNYHPQILFNFGDILYVPIFDVSFSDNSIDEMTDEQYIITMKENIKCIIVYSEKGPDPLIAILLRDSDGDVQEIGPVKFTQQYFEAIKQRLNDASLSLFA